MTVKPRILLVEDSLANALLYQNYLQPTFHVSVANDGAQAMQLYEGNHFDLLILDVQLPDTTGIALLQQFREHNAQLPIIIITAHGSVDVALEAMRLGANDFLSKPFDKARLEVTVNNLMKGQQLSRLISNYEKSCTRDRFEHMVGSSLVMQSVYTIIESAATSKATVFITGESGTGKELCAAAIHNTSTRKNKPFVALNCAAIPHDLLESEIFGHIKGAFTGAANTREGAAAKAHQGTLFLDEIGEMPLSLQSKLLRFIQTGRFQPVGGSIEVERDIRFICATNRDPLEEVRAGRFREDLYYRLYVIPIHMPSLRERMQDVLLIADSFLKAANHDESKHFSGFSEQVRQLFVRYSWPGNVRELQNVIRNVVVLNEGDTVTMSMLPANLKNNRQTPHSPPLTEASLPGADTDIQRALSTPASASSIAETASASHEQIIPLWLAEKHYIESVITRCQGNIPRAAAFLEISPSTIYRKKQQWNEKLA